MKTAFTLAIVLSAVGGMIKLFLQASGAEKIAKTLHNILGLLLLVTLLGSFSKVTFWKVTFSPQGNDALFSTLQEDTMKRVMQIAEEELAKKIKIQMQEVFDIEPNRCTVKINSQTLSVTEIQIDFSAEKSMYSTYAIKNFLQEEYGSKTEVTLY